MKLPITIETLDRDIELHSCETGMYLTSGAEVVGCVELYRQYLAAIRIIAELEAKLAQPAPAGGAL